MENLDSMTFVQILFMFLTIRVIRALMRNESFEDFSQITCIGITLLAMIYAVSILLCGVFF